MWKSTLKVVSLLLIVPLVVAAIAPACGRNPGRSDACENYVEKSSMLEGNVSSFRDVIRQEVDNWKDKLNAGQSEEAPDREHMIIHLKYGDDILKYGFKNYQPYKSQYNELKDAVDRGLVPADDVDMVEDSLQSVKSMLYDVNDMLKEHWRRVNELRNSLLNAE